MVEEGLTNRELRKAVWIVPLAFLLVLILVSSTIVVSFNTLGSMRQSMARILDEYTTESELVQSLNVVVQQRMTIMRDLMLEDDIFERDNMFQALNRLGGRYNAIFTELQQLELAPQGQKYLQDMQQYARDSSDLRLAIRDLVFELEHVDKNYILKASNDTNEKYNFTLAAMQAMLRAEADKEWQLADRDYQDWLSLLSILSITILVISVYISYRTTRYIYQTNHRLRSMALQKSMLLATMSHEIRTPLTSIIGFSETLLESDTTKEERIASINAIARNSRHLAQLINDILDFSKLEAQQLELRESKLELKLLLDDIHGLLHAQAEKKGLAFEISVVGRVPEYFIADETKLKQVLVNLLGNAIKFTNKGEITLELEFLAENGVLRFNIRDSGIGLNAEQQLSIFDPYKQVDGDEQSQGTGLGLYLSRQITHLMGGSMTLESEPGIGSCFSISIPAGDLSDLGHIQWQGETVEAVKNTLSRAIQLTGNVLLAEDREDNQQLFSIYLGKAGVNLTIVDNGIDAVNEALSGDYALLLMDMQMPLMDGLSALHSLREQGYTKPVIALTANHGNQEREACLSAGFDDFLSKPISRSDFIKVLANYLQSTESDELICETPIYSSIEDEELDIGPALAYFIKGLKGQYEKMTALLKEQDWGDLKPLVHDIKGSAGAVGYPMLTQLAMEIEFAIAKQDKEEVIYLMQLLGKQVERIELGYQEQLPQTGKNTTS